MPQEDPILYSFRRCPYAMRARLALSVSEQKVEHREVVLRNKPRALLDASPKGTVPVLVLPDGKVLDESLDIMFWALNQNDPKSWLPTDQEREDVMALIRQNDGPFKSALDRYKYPDRYEGASSAEARNQASEIIEALNQRLAEHGCLFGPNPGLGDMAILPFVRQFAHVDREWFYAKPWPAAIRWLDQFKASEIFKTIMKKHEAWTP